MVTKRGRDYLNVFAFMLLVSIFWLGCALRQPKFLKSEQQLKIDEFEKKVAIEVLPEPQPLSTQPSLTAQRENEQPMRSSGDKVTSQKKERKTKKAVRKKTHQPPATPESHLAHVHEPELEGQEGFVGRRPLVDPFVPGEKTVFDVSYMGMVAGQMSLEIKPFVQVNARKHYHFEGKIWTKPFFSRIYMVDDRFESMLDFETLLPSVYKLQVKETKQVKEARFFIDWPNHQAIYWEKKLTEEGEAEKKQEWTVEPFTQDVFSALFYLRVFPWKVGMKRGFRVADDEKNLVFWGEIIREEMIELEAGTFNTLVLRPEVELRGKMNPSGDFLIWITNDPYHAIVKIQAKLSFGTLKAEAVQFGR